MSPDDYAAVSNKSLKFLPCTTEVCINISTHHDNLVEGDEEFYVRLSTDPDLHGEVYLEYSLSMAVVTIVDNDGECYMKSCLTLT